MWRALFATLLIVTSTKAAADDPASGITFHSTKTLAALQKCLTDELAEVGEVVAVKSEVTTTTLVLRNIDGDPMTIDLAPPAVVVTSKFAPHTRHLIEACL